MVRKEQVPKLGRSVPEVHCVAAQCQAAEIPQRCPGMGKTGKTGHEAERGWFRAVWSGNIARSRCDKKMPRPISKVVLHKRGRPGCQGEGQIPSLLRNVERNWRLAAQVGPALEARDR